MDSSLSVYFGGLTHSFCTTKFFPAFKLHQEDFIHLYVKEAALQSINFHDLVK